MAPNRRSLNADSCLTTTEARTSSSILSLVQQDLEMIASNTANSTFLPLTDPREAQRQLVHTTTSTTSSSTGSAPHQQQQQQQQQHEPLKKNTAPSAANEDTTSYWSWPPSANVIQQQEQERERTVCVLSVSNILSNLIQYYSYYHHSHSFPRTTAPSSSNDHDDDDHDHHDEDQRFDSSSAYSNVYWAEGERVKDAKAMASCCSTDPLQQYDETASYWDWPTEEQEAPPALIEIAPFRTTTTTAGVVLSEEEAYWDW